VSKKMVVFGITSASGGIENLMHYFLLDCIKKNLFDEITIASSYATIAFEDEYKRNNIDVVHISSWKNRTAYKKDIDSVIKSLNQNDLLYLNLSTYCNWELLSCVKKANCKILIHGHNAHVDNPIKKVIHAIGKKRFNKVGYKIAVSEECSRFMFDGNHNIIISNGIDSNKFWFDSRKREAVRSQLSIEDDRIVLGCVGRISKEKNQLYLTKLSKKYKDILFLFIGDFMDKNYKKRILSLKRKNCLFIGSQTDIGFYLSGIDALIIPSKREAFPLAAAEALTNDMPIFFLQNIKGKIPSSMVSNANCHFIENNSLDLGIICSSHSLRRNHKLVQKKDYDISVFLNSLYCFLDSEVFYEH
jgi:glycosyltransferase involved in cell wall biosynthesis